MPKSQRYVVKVTYEFPQDHPVYSIVKVSASGPHTASARAILATRHTIRGRRPSSIVVLIEDAE